MFAFGQASPTPSFHFASASASENIPFESVANGLVLVSARVNHHAGWFILDNATEGWLADTDFAERSHLVGNERANTSGGGKNPIQGGIVRDVQINLPGLELTHRNLLVIPLKGIEPSVGHQVDGIIGSGLFNDFDVTIDYERRRVSISKLGRAQRSEGETAIPTTIDEHGFPYVDASIVFPGAASIHGRFLIDGGANTYADVYKPFADVHRIPTPAMKLLDEPGTGTGGVTQSRRGRASRISIGPFSVDDPTVTFAQDTEGLLAASNYAGLIGTEFLERFTVVFDNPGKRVLLSPNRHYGDAVEADASGLRLQAEGPGFHRFVVARVLTPSPAADAGIASGDVLESIDGRAAGTLMLTEVRSMLCRPNAHYALAIVRQDRHLQLLLTLHPLM
jgi:Aspartyl protease